MDIFKQGNIDVETIVMSRLSCLGIAKNIQACTLYPPDQVSEMVAAIFQIIQSKSLMNFTFFKFIKTLKGNQLKYVKRKFHKKLVQCQLLIVLPEWKNHRLKQQSKKCFLDDAEFLLSGIHSRQTWFHTKVALS